MYRVDNAVIMAAGISSRFVPLSYEKPKALIEVRGEKMIERQIRQLQEAGIPEIIVVTGYRAEMFAYLKERYGVKLIHNREYLSRNNHASIYAARAYLKNTYICSADNYFLKNPFESYVSNSYYAALYADGPTKEWCMCCDEKGRIQDVRVGGENAWYMLGHAFWNEHFSARIKMLIEAEYDHPETKGMFWEDIYIRHINELEMVIRQYGNDEIFEFDTLDELREFDSSYIADTRSSIMKGIAEQLYCGEDAIRAAVPLKDRSGEVYGFQFDCLKQRYQYEYASGILRKVKEHEEGC